MGLTLVPDRGITIKTAAGEVSEMLSYVAVPLRVQGVMQHVDAYAIDQEVSYNILLGLPWMHRVGCVINYATMMVWIWGANGKCRQVEADSTSESLQISASATMDYDITLSSSISVPRLEIEHHSELVESAESLRSLTDEMMQNMVTKGEEGYEDDEYIDDLPLLTAGNGGGKWGPTL